jgi:hypothetical protein
MKIVINRCYGAYMLSPRATALFQRIEKCEPCEAGRDNPTLVKIVEKLGEAAGDGPGTNLKVVEVPDGVDWYIQENDGMERVAERHRFWY